MRDYPDNKFATVKAIIKHKKTWETATVNLIYVSDRNKWLSDDDHSPLSKEYDVVYWEETEEGKNASKMVANIEYLIEYLYECDCFYESVPQAVKVIKTIYKTQYGKIPVTDKIFISLATAIIEENIEEEESDIIDTRAKRR